MAPPRPKQNFQQRQPITTTLRNICQSYPTSTCLRELLQNADDAGASEIEYVLDTKSYFSEGPLLHDELQEYHGPALLARNNSVFRDEDFGSLSSVGDSVKRDDPASTGKFGQGFNSVYHWTDGPWVYSRNWLLFLDPHARWSSETHVGGPAWDVVESHACAEIQNHLRTFGAFNMDHSQVLKETVIRLPLRTPAQASTSKIVNRAISTEDIKQALENFGEEIQQGGLLFLKHISKVIIRIDETTLLIAQNNGGNSHDASERKALPADFRRLFGSDASPDSQNIFRRFETSIDYVIHGISRTDKYLIHHSMASSCGDTELDAWARDWKLFPWVAVAAPLAVSSFSGRLFSTLSLPILTHQPVHLHGLFAIAPDRARLGFEEAALKWNKYMFQQRLSATWIKLLEDRSFTSWSVEGFKLWPKANLISSDLWTRLDEWIVEGVITHDLVVWNSIKGCCVQFSHSQFLEDDAKSERYAPALAKVQAPVVLLDGALFQKVKKAAAGLGKNFKEATPHTVRHFIRDINQIPDEAAPLIAEFCLLDAMSSELKGTSRATLYNGFQDIRLWPTMDGTLTAPKTHGLFLPRNDAEMQLFSNSRSSDTLNITRLTPSAYELLKNDIAYIGAIMRYRISSDLAKDWPTILPMAKQEGWSVQRSWEPNPLIRNIWAWICARLREENTEIPSTLHDLWLVPINDFRIRRLGPGKATVPTLILENGETLAELLSDMISRDPSAMPPLLEENKLPLEAMKLLRKCVKTDGDLRFACQDHLETFVDWLVAGKSMLARASAQQKKDVLNHLFKLLRGKTLSSTQKSQILASQVRKLPLFTKTSSSAPFDKRNYTTCDLDHGGHLYEAPLGLPPLPDIAEVSFYDVSDTYERYIVKELQLVEEISIQNLLDRHFLPWMATARDPSTEPAKEGLVDWIFDNSKNYTHPWRSNLKNHPLIPLPKSAQQCRQYRCLKDLVNPTSDFSGLYFQEEDKFPCPEFYKRHEAALALCGINNGTTSSTPLERARHYSKCGADLQELREKVECLLTVPIRGDFTSSRSSMNDIRSLKWLPGSSTVGDSTLLSPDSCRGADQSDLIDNVWGTSNLDVRGSWREILGWDKPVPKSVLFQQLDHCLEKHEYDKVENILVDIQLNDRPELRSKPCILGRHGDYFRPDRVFLPNPRLDFYSLAPHLDEVDAGFARKHRELLSSLEVKPEPSAEDLQYAQKALDGYAEGQLSENGLSVAIAILEVATTLHYEPSTFLIPDTTSCLRKLTDIVYGDRNVTGEVSSFNFTHPRISEDLIKRLRVENSYARAMRLEIDFEDEDEDEFTPREKLSTIICDTLGRYPIDTTFNEFLANADDAKAGRISWTLDERFHDSRYLLSDELQPFQGPALIAFNDEIFSEENFAGFKEIGQGGKGDDATTTGMFGRGSLSMYHFTDVPMLISGDFYLVLDPQQQYLPRNKYYKRKVGIKISLERVRRIAPDQLQPFDGLYGFDAKQNHYAGTLFRFPMRQRGARTLLKDTGQDVDLAVTRNLLEQYFVTARISLLFLQNVTEIDFRVRSNGDEKLIWCVSTQRSEGSDDEVFQQVTVESTVASDAPMIDIWRIGVMDLEQSPAGVRKVGKGVSKISECGVAACLQKGKITSTQDFETARDTFSQRRGDQWQNRTELSQRIFCRLPTTSRSQLPVSFHASFAITGDRKTIAFEDESDTSTWNNWLLKDCIPEFYLDFLKDLAPRLGQKTFNFWPSTLEVTQRTLSNTVCEAFWDKIMDQTHASYQLYPTLDFEGLAVNNEKNDLRRATPRKTRKLHRVTSVSGAYFDFLADDVSSQLRRLFAILGLRLVRPPKRIWKQIKTAASAQQVVDLNPVNLAKIFREEANCRSLEGFLAHLDDEAEKLTALAMLLESLIPATDKSLKSSVPATDLTPLDFLDGCRILPKVSLSAPLGLLNLEPKEDASWHLVASSEEQDLFAFAAESLINTNLPRRSTFKVQVDGMPKYTNSRDPIREIMEAPFNIRCLEVRDIGFLLAHPACPVATGKESADRDEWILKFWKYANKCFQKISSSWDPAKNINSGDLLSKANLWDMAVCRFRNGEEWRYITPRQVKSQPCVVESDSIYESKLLAHMPALNLLDRDCLPYLLVEAESNLTRNKSFLRLLNALKLVEKSTGITVKKYLNNTLSSESTEILQELLITFLCSDLKTDAVPDKSFLQDLPVWPRLKHSSIADLPKYIAAKDARFCKHSNIFMPWMRDITNFVDPKTVHSEEATLIKLGVELVRPQEFWNHVKKDLPAKLGDQTSRLQYLKLLRHLHDYGIVPAEKIAPNGHGILCKVDSLYDSEDVIFKAAFYAEQPRRFLHPDVRIGTLRSFWLSAGLRMRSAGNAMSSGDYLECALAIDRQWTPAGENPIYDQGAKVVSAHLQFNLPGFQIWSDDTWQQIWKVRMFRVEMDVSNQPLYRQARMRQISQKHAHCALRDAGRVVDQRILWSQVKFLKDPPDFNAFNKLPTNCSPLIVNYHLQFLISVLRDVQQNDLQEFLKDIQACYHYLQENAEGTTSIPGIQEANVFFNVDTTQLHLISKDDLQANLTCAKLLCLNSPVDPLPIKVACKFLVPYERLLSSLGCQTVNQPPTLARETIQNQPPMTETLIQIQKLRDQGQLTDVIFTANGEEKHAHKIFLAAVSDYCQARFLGNWGKRLQYQATIDVEPITYSALSDMVDFAYTGDFNAPELEDETDRDEIAEALDQMLDLLQGTDMWQMLRLHDMVEDFLATPPNSAIYVRVDNVKYIKEYAERTNAHRLARYCSDFIAANSKMVDAVSALE